MQAYLPLPDIFPVYPRLSAEIDTNSFQQFLQIFSARRKDKDSSETNKFDL